MNTLTMTSHSTVRMAQRGIKLQDAELIALIGTEVDHGFIVLLKDYQEVERQLKNIIDRVRRLVGKRAVVADGRVVTIYHASKRYERRLLRNAYERDPCKSRTGRRPKRATALEDGDS
jgi:hypothetical protein